jgi:hypothetical protein
VLDVVQPEFRPATAASAILTANCLLTIGGDGAAVVSGGQTVFGFSPAIVANGGSVSIDPAVGTPTFPAGAAPFAGTAPVVVQSVPASWTATAQAGQTLAIESSAAAGSVVFQCLGSPAPHVGTPLGVLGIDAGQPLAFFAPTVLPASGRASFALPVPAALPSGSAFATQAVVLTGGTLGLGLPTTFVLR